MKNLKQSTLRRLVSLGMLLVLMGLFTVLGKEYFLNTDNILSILRDAAVVGIIGVGLTYVIITSGIDLSTGSAMALVGMTMANIYEYTLLPIPFMILIGIIMGVLTGCINGVIVAKLQLPEFIATLATMGVFRAITYIIAIKDSNGIIKSQPMTVSEFTIYGKGIGGIHYVVIALIIFVVAGQIILKYTRFGTNLYSVGANKKAATLSGIDVAKTRMIAYIITGICVAFGAVFTTSRLQSTTALLGSGFEFSPIAACVVGGVALSGGSGDVIGTFIGAIFMATLENGILKLQMNTAYQYIIKGSIIIAVVIFDAVYKASLEHKAKEVGAKGGA